jgi:hypothetical protein
LNAESRGGVVVTDLLGLSGLRILHALANGEIDSENLAMLEDFAMSEGILKRTSPGGWSVSKLACGGVEPSERIIAESVKLLHSLRGSRGSR